MSTTIQKKTFGQLPSGEEVSLFVLENEKGMRVQISNFGQVINSIKVPNAQGVLEESVLGFETLEPYLSNAAYLGVLVGRYANRIAGAKFSLDGQEYQLSSNENGNQLHGGAGGFHKQLWEAEILKGGTGDELLLKCFSKSGEEGFPGNLHVSCHYTLNEFNELEVSYHATTDQLTIVNLTRHDYFNLYDAGKSSALDHRLTIQANHYLPIDKFGIPLGDIMDVSGTAFDFRKPKSIREQEAKSDLQVIATKGIDHNFVLSDSSVPYRLAASVYEPKTKRSLEVWCTQPGLQLYTGIHLEDFPAKSGFCLEAQAFPNSPNQDSFETPILKPGSIYQHKLKYKFF